MPSKKRFAAKRLDETVFFVDRSLGIEPIRSMLVQAGLHVEIHDDHFARDAEDQVWLSVVGDRNWVVFTKDQRLRYRPLELAALRASKTRVFVLTAGNLRGQEIRAAFGGRASKDIADFAIQAWTFCRPGSRSRGVQVD